MPTRLFTVALTIILSILASALFAACAAGPMLAPVQSITDKPAPAPGEVTLLDVRGRPGPLAGGTSAVYLTILNGLDHEVRLTGASSPVAAVVELHETINDNGVMRMIPQPEGFVIPPQQSVELKPGGKHVMLIDLSAPLAVGDEIPLQLVFEGSEAMSITVPIVEMVAGMSMAGDQHGNAGAAMAGDEHSHEHEEAHEEHGEAHEHGAMLTELQAAVAALPIHDLHAMDDALMAGSIDPEEAVAVVDELLAGLEAVTWPEELHDLIENLTTAADDLRAALVEGNWEKAGELAEQVHDLAHELEFQTE